MENAIDFRRRKELLGRNIFEARMRLGISGTELGLRIGSDKSAVSKIENGERNPSFEMILKMADALETLPEELIRVNEEPSESVWMQDLERKIYLLEPEARHSAQITIEAMINGLLLKQGADINKI